MVDIAAPGNAKAEADKKEFRKPSAEAKAGFLSDIVATSTETVSPAGKVFVYEGPLRLWHWVNAGLIVVLCVTGYFIAKPPPSLPGEASDHFLLGNIRMVHFAAGQLLAVAFLGRIYWAFVGNDHARQIFLLPVWSGKWWREVLFELKWYGFLEPTPKKYIGHNPMAQLAMFTLFVVPVTLQILTGFALYAEGQGTDSWWFAVFGWVFGVFGDNSFAVHTYHHLFMWVIVVFSIVHIYAAVREDIMSRQSLISTMVSGWRYFKDDKE